MEPFTETRPWGNFRQFTLNEPVTVKILHLNPNSSLSLQKHKKRTEFWHVISGGAKVTAGDRLQVVQTGDEVIIGEGVEHRVESGDSPLELLEVTRGEFDEHDEVRLKDEYGRK